LVRTMVLAGMVLLCAPLDAATPATVVAWGGNDYGETTVPVGLSNAMAIAAANYSVALRTNGTVVAWGYNYYGVTNVPAGLTNVIAISAGGMPSSATLPP